MNSLKGTSSTADCSSCGYRKTDSWACTKSLIACSQPLDKGFPVDSVSRAIRELLAPLTRRG